MFFFSSSCLLKNNLVCPLMLYNQIGVDNTCLFFLFFLNMGFIFFYILKNCHPFNFGNYLKVVHETAKFSNVFANFILKMIITFSFFFWFSLPSHKGKECSLQKGSPNGSSRWQNGMLNNSKLNKKHLWFINCTLS